ncbi:DUF1707 SHOCT-like domain-containing protein [Blastococcus sp. PRF04-17]|uniref:DUF1707 SHOCT-like domain-containing protein n=1 Tax=Blastococcus sp. PRF04-17 TaxID=2933797 RepID=UPI001FF0FB76|nr:DUF1707 domain-containing protein [Blastococcus sp. PRF04-17]UOY00530.1 DUF1707 domain-containing protein [Blastococcus sp. PRF04-17]
MPEPHLRAADADRAAVAEALGAHMSAGRLTLEEYDERLARAYSAKTYGELAELTADLPNAPRHRPPTRTEQSAPALPASASAQQGPWGWDDRHSWRAWASTAVIVLVIWAATSLANWELLYFWPVWVIGPWGAVLLARTITSAREGGDGHRRLSS